MKRIILIRHAKSDWNNANLDDFDRPLSKRWIREIKFVNKILKNLDLKTDLILCSSAKRTEETLEWIWENIDADKDKIVYEKWIYDNNWNLDYYVNLLKKQDDKIENLALIWHNYFITELLQFLSWDEILEMQTLWVAVIDLQIDSWDEIKVEIWKLVFFISPKFLME